MRSKQLAQQLRHYKEVREAKDCLESGIRLIRDQYEGGEPPV